MITYTKIDITKDDMIIIVTRTFFGDEYKLNYVPTKPRMEEI